jgi:class 3 adenylate cyclase/HAMP domain-containing protein
MKLSFRAKLALAITCLAVSMTSLGLVIFYLRSKSLVLEQLGGRLNDIGQTAVHLFGPPELLAIQRLTTELDKRGTERGLLVPHVMPQKYVPTLEEFSSDVLMKSSEFTQLVELLRKIKQSTARAEPLDNAVVPEGMSPTTLAYVTLLIPIAESPDRKVLQFIADADFDNPDWPNPIGTLFFNDSRGITSALDGKSGADPDFAQDGEKYLLSGGVPVRDASGKVIAVLALDYDAMGEVNEVQQLFYSCIVIVAGSFLLSLVVAWILARLFDRPIRALRAGAERVAARDFSTEVRVDTNDELGLLAAAFNTMVRQIQSYSIGLEQINRAYERFVPQQFLQHLGIPNITEVKLGDQVQRQMTVLFCDIRSFTTISESMSPRDNFEFINQYLSTVSPIIREHGGFIDKYIGDAIMALFPEGPRSAVRAAIAMQRALVGFNRMGKELGRPPVRIGVGVHSGNLMLGTVGDDVRMQGTVISDAVNLASRLESLTKEYGVSVMVSERVVEGLEGAEDLHLRKLGKVQVKGKSKETIIYEVIDAEEEDSARRKILTTADFEKGLKNLEKARYRTAGKFFARVLRLHRGDVAAQRYWKEARRSAGRRLRTKAREDVDLRSARFSAGPVGAELLDREGLKTKGK